MTTAETYSPGEYKGLLRADFASFAQHCFRELNPRTPFTPNWHHEFIAAKLATVRDGRIRRLIINVPPRHLSRRRHQFAQQLEALAVELPAQDRDPGDIAAGAAKLSASPSSMRSGPPITTIGIVYVKACTGIASIRPAAT